MLQSDIQKGKLAFTGQAPTVPVLIKLPGMEKKLECGGEFSITTNIN